MIPWPYELQLPVATKVEIIRSTSLCLVWAQHSAFVILVGVKLDLMIRGRPPYVVSLRTNDRGRRICRHSPVVDLFAGFSSCLPRGFALNQRRLAQVPLRTRSQPSCKKNAAVINNSIQRFEPLQVAVHLRLGLPGCSRVPLLTALLERILRLMGMLPGASVSRECNALNIAQAPTSVLSTVATRQR